MACECQRRWRRLLSASEAIAFEFRGQHFRIEVDKYEQHTVRDDVVHVRLRKAQPPPVAAEIRFETTIPGSRREAVKLAVPGLGNQVILWIEFTGVTPLVSIRSVSGVELSEVLNMTLGDENSLAFAHSGQRYRAVVESYEPRKVTSRVGPLALRASAEKTAFLIQKEP